MNDPNRLNNAEDAIRRLEEVSRSVLNRLVALENPPDQQPVPPDLPALKLARKRARREFLLVARQEVEQRDGSLQLARACSDYKLAEAAYQDARPFKLKVRKGKGDE